MSWIKDLVQKLSRPGDVVMYFCEGACSTAKASMFLDEHKTFVECVVDSKLQTGTEPEPM